MGQYDQGRRTVLRALGAMLLGASLGVQVGTEPAGAAGCGPRVPAGGARPPAPPDLAADLSAPFRYRPDDTDRSTLLLAVADVVRAQAADLGAEACFRDLPAEIVGRVDFLSPYEFLVVTLFEQEPARRDALLDLYAADPRAAIRALDEHAASVRAQSILMNYAYFDLASERIRVNAARVPSADLARVLVHEFWHALPTTRSWREPDGRLMRAHGFALQERPADSPIWLPVDDPRGLPFPSYLLDEGMATLMETQYAGPSPYARGDVVDAQAYLEQRMAEAGPASVVGSYLDSRPFALVGAAGVVRRPS